MRTILLTIILILSSHYPALSDVTFEGANDEIVILTGLIEIEELDEMLELMKAKKPTQIILALTFQKFQYANQHASYYFWLARNDFAKAS